MVVCAVAHAYGLSSSSMLRGRGRGRLLEARQVVARLARDLCGSTWPELAAELDVGVATVHRWGTADEGPDHRARREALAARVGPALLNLAFSAAHA